MQMNYIFHLWTDDGHGKRDPHSLRDVLLFFARDAITGSHLFCRKCRAASGKPEYKTPFRTTKLFYIKQGYQNLTPH